MIDCYDAPSCSVCVVIQRFSIKQLNLYIQAQVTRWGCRYSNMNIPCYKYKSHSQRHLRRLVFYVYDLTKVMEITRLYFHVCPSPAPRAKRAAGVGAREDDVLPSVQDTVIFSCKR